MRLTKTEAGVKAMRDRSVPLTARQRGAFILCDSRYPKSRVLANARMAGVAESDIDYLIHLGLVAEIADEQELAAERAAEEFHNRPPIARFKDAYPMAVRLSGAMGLKGFRLNMAVERCGSYEDLCRVLPALKAAVKPEMLRPLEQALYG
ncbi:MAG: hypothetical protein HYX47_21345 [Burkholderiales bacterium]|nr:hypothetical protein [Burkholderiales bacterium]